MAADPRTVHQRIEQLEERVAKVEDKLGLDDEDESATEESGD